MEFNKADIKKLNHGIHGWDWNDKYLTPNKDIVENDLKLVEDADILVAVFPDNLTIGITCEMFWAWKQNKTVLSFVPARLLEHPWINYCSKCVFIRIEDPIEVALEIISYLREKL